MKTVHQLTTPTTSSQDSYQLERMREALSISGIHNNEHHKLILKSCGFPGTRALIIAHHGDNGGIGGIGGNSNSTTKVVIRP